MKKSLLSWNRFIHTVGRKEALYARFWILSLEGVDNTEGEGLGFWWGLGEGGVRGSSRPASGRIQRGH